uniref:Serine (or cysteine) peptidase inhibitor, clade H, member 2 n=1 Tax=Haplochromis burtoni TaxID=8153 RepID=A0A3Q2WQB0_HAPBU
MLPRLPFCLLISLPVLLVQGSITNSSKKSADAPAGPVSRPPPLPPPPQGDPSWTLGLRLYQALRSDSSSVNVIFSPLLVASSLGALGEASVGNTSSQVRGILNPPSPDKAGTQVPERLAEALKSFSEANGTSFHLHASSAVFSKQVSPVDQAFVKQSQARFRVQHQTLGKGDSKADLKQLQDWAKAGLSGLEGAPLEAEIKARAGALILANAVRLKGLWEREFNEESADRRTFLGKKYTKVVMMHRAGLYRFHEDTDNMVQVLEAPLWGGRASVVLLLPFHVENLAKLEKLLTLELLSKWLEKASVTSVAISLPKANITSTLSLQMSNEIIRLCFQSISLDKIFKGYVIPSKQNLSNFIQRFHSCKESYLHASQVYRKWGNDRRSQDVTRSQYF